MRISSSDFIDYKRFPDVPIPGDQPGKDSSYKVITLDGKIATVTKDDSPS